MARKRFITSDMSIDEKIADIAAQNPIAALMWPWFITAFDDWGRLDVSSPTKIKLEVFPAFSFGADEIIKAIDMYSNTGLVFRYNIDKKTYIAIEPCKYYKYQTYIKERKRTEDNSSIPAPTNAPWENCTHCRALARTVADSRGFGTLSVPSPSPSPSPSIKERDIYSKNMEEIGNKAFEFGMSGLTPEFIQDMEMRLNEGTEPELIVKALSIAATKASGGAGSKCRYAISILQGWAAEGIKTLAQWNEKNTPKPTAREKPTAAKSKAEERMEMIRRAREQAHKILDEQGGVGIDDTG